MAEREYRRLTRAKNRSRFAVVSTSRTSLWLGKDHLLQIETSGYTETYKRFHFRDIQALVLCRTDTWLYQGVGLLGVACLFGLIAVVGGGPVVAWIFGSIAGLFGLILLLHLLAGPSSKCYLRTAVQTEPLASLNRLRKARKVFGMLRPLIVAAQAEPAQPSAPLPGQDNPPVISAPPPSIGPAAEASNPPTSQPA